MTDPLFLLDDLTDPLPMVGTHLALSGDEGRHAAVVRRIRPGEMIMIGDGRGRGVRGSVVEARPSQLVVEVAAHLTMPDERGAWLQHRRWPKATGLSWLSR